MFIGLKMLLCLSYVYVCYKCFPERSIRGIRIGAIGVCKKMVAAFSSSWKKKKALADAQEQLKLPQHKLIAESPTIWGSRQRMIEMFLEQEKPFVMF